MKLRYAFLCDYAAPGPSGKATVVGIHDAIVGDPSQPPHTSDAFLHAAIDAPTIVGKSHTLGFRLIDADGGVLREGALPFEFGEKHGEAHGYFGYVYLRLSPVLLPDFGDYEWVLLIDGVPIGSVPICVFPSKP